MERTSKESTEGKPLKRKVSFDWQGFGMQLGMFVLQGACFALGGLAVSTCKEALTSPKREDGKIPDNVTPFKKVALS